MFNSICWSINMKTIILNIQLHLKRCTNKKSGNMKKLTRNRYTYASSIPTGYLILDDLKSHFKSAWHNITIMKYYTVMHFRNLSQFDHHHFIRNAQVESPSFDCLYLFKAIQATIEETKLFRLLFSFYSWRIIIGTSVFPFLTVGWGWV